MATFTDLWPSQFISGEEIHNRPEEYWDVTMKNIRRSPVKNPEGKEKLAVLVDVEECDRPVLMCKTAGQSVKALWGGDASEWIGKRIRLVPLWGKFFGKEQYAVRVAPVKLEAKRSGGKTEPSGAALEKARKLALDLVSASPALDSWYETARSGEGISRNDLADWVVKDLKRLGLKLSCTPDELLEKLSDSVQEPVQAERDAGSEG